MYRNSIRSAITPLLFLAPALLLVAVFVYYPVVENVRLSLFSWSAFSPEPVWAGLNNYRQLLADPVFWTALKNNVLYAVVSIIFQVGGALVLGAILEETLVKRFRVFFRSVYFIPTVISITVVGLLFQFLYDPQMGLIDQLLAALGHANWARAWLGDERTAIWAVIAMSQWQSVGYLTLLFIVSIQRIPRELYEAAALDGASRMRIFFHITVPLVREMTVLASIITISGAFMVFNDIMVTTQGGPNNASQTLATWMYQSAFSNDQMGYASAIATIIFLITFGAAAVNLWVSRSGQEAVAA